MDLSAVEPSPEERATILAALPEEALDERYRDGVASVIVHGNGRLLDGVVHLARSPVVRVRPSAFASIGALEIYVALLERRRAQIRHDLSGPATGVLAALETVLEFEPIPESSRALLLEARRGMMGLTRLLGDRTSMLGTPNNAVEGPLLALTRRWSENARAALDPIGERLRVEVTANSAEIRLDAARCEGALAVLLANAWKYRGGHGIRAQVRARAISNGVAFDVSDDGRGLDRESLQRAGELGFCARPSGVGLGLFLLRWSVRGGGAVVLRAQPRGATASVFVPSNSPAD